jgi:hypothetical protein
LPTHTYGNLDTMREPFRSISSFAEVLLWRDGGQRQARRNAWAAMVTDARRARERAEVAVAVEQLSWPHGSRIEGLRR